MHEDEAYLQKLVSIGVRAFVLKKSVGEDLFQAIRAAYEGERYVDPSLGGTVISSMFGPPKENNISELDKLTPREREVCRLLARGHTNAEIGEQLSISLCKIETDRSSIMAKLSLSSRAELVRFAIGKGLLKPE
jgi:two-component system response regulator NreC